MESFASWEEVLAAASTGILYYQGPMDYRARKVRVDTLSPVLDGGKPVLRVRATIDCDPFVADETHLNRFRRLA